MGIDVVENRQNADLVWGRELGGRRAKAEDVCGGSLTLGTWGGTGRVGKVGK